MNRLDFCTKVYASLHNHPHIPFWLLTPFRKIVRCLSNAVLPSYLSRKHELTVCRKEKIIVSFTSFPARIDNVWQVVECMYRQTLQPAKIILWLSKAQFPTKESIPQSLRDREGDIFEIRMVDGDIRSHKKYYYVSKEYPDSLIFLIDDDIYYPTDIIEKSMREREQYPDAVICNYGYHIGYDENGKLKPYKKWKRENNASTDNDLFFGSGGGTLFCPSDLHPDLLNVDKAISLAPLADDIWLNAMARLTKRKIVMLDNGLVLSVFNRNNVSLASQNVGMDENDKQLDAVNRAYNYEVFVRQNN